MCIRDRAAGDTGWRVAMVAALRGDREPQIRHLALQALADPVAAVPVGNVVLRLARDDAVHAADAFLRIDDHAETRHASRSLFDGHEVHVAVSYTHLRAHETVLDLVCRILL